MSLPSRLPGLAPACTWVLALVGRKESSSVELSAPGSPWCRELPGVGAASVCIPRVSCRYLLSLQEMHSSLMSTVCRQPCFSAFWLRSSVVWGLPRGLSDEESACQCRRHRR